NNTQLNNPVYIHGGQYHLLGVNVREKPQVEESLSGADLEFPYPAILPFVIVWAECCLHGWEQCLDMNEFYLGLIPQKETRGVESLEPFDAFEVSYSNLESCENTGCLACPPLCLPLAEPPPLAVRPVVGEMCVEGLGMPLGPGLVLLSGGSGWGGREDTTARVLIRAKGGWRCACSVLLPGVILYHTVTSVPGRGAVFGGRSSPLNPIRTLLRVTYDNVTCLTPLPLTARWRHTLTMGEESVLLGETVLLRPTTTGFCWERLHLQPPLVYSHSVHVIGDWMMLVCQGLLAKCHLSLLYTSSLLYPGLSCCTPSARHSFCSALLGDSDQSTTMALIGGEGNCFSVVTHHNPHPISVDLKPVL
uniref:Uncharacterized protein n=1 Tax=Oncorhynchus mykiss TaxID=8022 RepID=A0A8K9VGJ4_ONCMY